MPRKRLVDLYPEEIQSETTPSQLTQVFDSYVQEARRIQRIPDLGLNLMVGMETEWIYSDQANEINALRKQYK